MSRDHASVDDVAGTAGAVAAVTAAGVKTCSITNDTTGGGIRRTFRPKAPATTLPAGDYLFTIWIRDANFRGSIAFELYELTPENGKGTYVKTTMSTMQGAWAALQITHYTTAPVTGWYIDLWLDNGPPANSCFNADEATLVYTP